MSAGPTTRRIGRVARSCSRRGSSWSPRIAAESGVSTNPAAIRLTRTGASSSARFLTSAGPARGERPDQGESLGRAPAAGAAHEEQAAAGAHLPPRVPGDLDRQQEMGLDVPARLLDLELSQGRVVGTGAGDQHVVHRARQLVEEPDEPGEVGGVERRDAGRADLDAGLLEPGRVTGGEDEVGALRARKPGRLEPDARAAADDEQGLSAERLGPGRPGEGSGGHGLRASMALTVFPNAFSRTPLPTVPSTSPSARPLRFLPSRTTTASTSVLPSGRRVKV